MAGIEIVTARDGGVVVYDGCPSGLEPVPIFAGSYDEVLVWLERWMLSECDRHKAAGLVSGDCSAPVL